MMLSFVSVLCSKNNTKPHTNVAKFNTKPHFEGRTAKNSAELSQTCVKRFINTLYIKRRKNMLDERLISEIVASVVKSTMGTPNKQKGVFPTMSEALSAVDKAYKQYRSYSIEQRERMIAKIRELTLAEAEVMAAKGYSEKDVLTADVQKAYAEGIGNMTITGTGGGVAGDMIGLGVGMAAAGAIAPQLQEMLNTKNINMTSDASVKCPKCGNTIPSGSKFCPECGHKFANTITCPSCNKEIPAGSKFCLECGYKFATTCPKCNKDIPVGSKFCLECGEKI